jgi:transcriptional regulator of arginine metabolism
MNAKKERLEVICEIIKTYSIGNQDELLKHLHGRGFLLTQATLSRDIKQLKIAKAHDGNNNYVYTLQAPTVGASAVSNINMQQNLSSVGYIGLDFSGDLAVIKTRPGYAMAIASDIDTKAPHAILATIAGDDTVLLIPRDGITRLEVVDALSSFIPDIKKNRK